MHYVKAKGILSAHNGMNLYRGCLHGCIYCDSRSRCYRMEHRFEDIEIKENAIELLEAALKRKRAKCMIGTGSMSDPYNPIEGELGYMRKALKLVEQYGFGMTLITKSDRVLRDIDLLKRINDRTKCVVQMTLTTCDEALCRKLEPHVSTTRERVRALKKLRAAGIPTVVWLCPILPYINDTQDNLMGILDACIDAGVRGIICFGMGLTLREGNREYFYRQLDDLFPGLKERYIKQYGNQYHVGSPREETLMRVFHRVCEENHIMHDARLIFDYLNTFEEKQEAVQLNLLDGL